MKKNSRLQQSKSSKKNYWSKTGKYTQYIDRTGIIVLAFTGLLVISFTAALLHLKEQSRENLANLLQNELYLTHKRVNSTFSNQTHTIETWATHNHLRDAIEQLQSLSDKPELLISHHTQEELREFFKSIFRFGYTGFFIIDKNLINLASDKNENIGERNLLAQQKNLFHKVWAGNATVSLPQHSNIPIKDIYGDKIEGLATMFVAAPIKDSNNNTIAILTFGLDPDEFFTPIFHRGTFGSSGETYAFNNQGLLLSESRFNRQLYEAGLIKNITHSDLNVYIRDPGVNLLETRKKVSISDNAPYTLMAQSAISGKKGTNLDGYTDYRGASVIGSWLWDDNLGFGIATELNYDEAYSTYHYTRNIIILSLILSVLLLLSISLIFTYGKKVITERDHRNRLILENAGEGIFGIDNNGLAKFVNPSACNILGYTEHEIIGKQVHELIHHSFEDGSKYPLEKCYIHDTLNNGNRHHIENEVLWKKDGSFIPVEYTTSPAGKPNGAVVTFQDITERKRTHETLMERTKELDFQKYALNQHAIVSMTDAVGNITYVNKNFCTITGYRKYELLGQNHRILKSDEHAEEFYHDLWTTITKGSIWRNEIKSKKKNGDCYWATMTIVPFLDKDNQPFRFIAIRTDITKQKNTEEKLKAAIVEAESANQAKTFFLSSMSHELRTPMNSILGFAQILQLDKKEPLSGRQQKSINYIIQSGKHLTTLIDDVLDLSKIESGKINLSMEEVNIDNIFNECINTCKSQAKELGINLISKTANQSHVIADYTRLKQIILNLLSNAIKYNKNKGEVILEYQDISNDKVRISVTDNGIGIPPDIMENVFTPFDRLGYEMSGIEGTGIGLSISKMLVEAMNGSIDLSSSPGKGSKFWIDLPKAQAAYNEPEKSNSIPQQTVNNNEIASQEKILYIEDNPINISLMETIIEDIENISLLTAHNAELGLIIAQEFTPMLILMDINLPGMNGIEAMYALKSTEKTKDIPVIAISAAVNQNIINIGKAAGFKACLTKPINIEELKKEIYKELDLTNNIHKR